VVDSRGSMDSNLAVGEDSSNKDSSLRNQQQNQKMITIMLWELKEMQLKIKLRKHLRNKRSSTTRTRTGMTRRKLNKSSKKSPMLTKFCQTQINEEFMINKARREYSNKLNGKAQDKEVDRTWVTSTLTLMTSLVVVVAEDNTFILINNKNSSRR
jgi:hypothetical protein